jgi:hypothetical protein
LKLVETGLDAELFEQMLSAIISSSDSMEPSIDSSKVSSKEVLKSNELGSVASDQLQHSGSTDNSPMQWLEKIAAMKSFDFIIKFVDKKLIGSLSRFIASSSPDSELIVKYSIL